MAQLRNLPAILAILMLAASPVAAADGAYLIEFEDLPLAPGLTENPGGMLFESPTGRIVEATASGQVAAQQVLSFYLQALPQLGWEKVGENSFLRDNELLRIDVDGKGRATVVRFSVVPQ